MFKPRDGQAHQVALAPINYYENHGERSSARCLIPKVLPLPVLQNVLAPCASLFRDLVSLHALASNSVNMSPVLQVQVPK